MVLLNDDPSQEWKAHSGSHHCEIYIGGKISFMGFMGELVPRGGKQNLVAQALRIDAIE